MADLEWSLRSEPGRWPPERYRCVNRDTGLIVGHVAQGEWGEWLLFDALGELSSRWDTLEDAKRGLERRHG